MSEGIQPSVLWREGMFLCPQHLQALTREVAARTAEAESVGQPGAYGVVSLRIDEEALERDVFKIIGGELSFRDGQRARFGQNASIQPREFGEHFTGTELSVYVGIAAARENVPQVGSETDRAYRYDIDVRTTHDENLRDATKEIEFRRLRAHLFFGDEDRSGYETLPVAKLVRVGQPEPHSALSPSWIPPLVRVDGSRVLVELLDGLAQSVRAQALTLSALLPDTTRLASTQTGADLSGMVKLQAVNQSLPLLEQVARVGELHPWTAYAELLRIVGNLALFGPDRVAPELAAYDHARSFDCFQQAADTIRALLQAEVSVPYDKLAFQEDERQEGMLEVSVPKEWLDKDPVFYLAVEMNRPQEKAAELVDAGVKLLAPADLEHVLQGIVPGIGLSPVRIPPLSFPKRKNLHFFEIETEGASRDLWVHVLEARKAMVMSALGSIEQVSYGLYVELRG